MSKYFFRPKHWPIFLAGSVLALAACAGVADYKTSESTVSTTEALTPGGGGGGGSTAVADLVPCAAWSTAVVANTGSVTINAATLVDSYVSSAGAYGGSNVGAGAIIQAGTGITNNGGTIRGILRPNSPGKFTIVPVPAGASKLPLGSSSPGSLNINTAADSITLAPGNYVAANINVNFPGAINISPT